MSPAIKHANQRLQKTLWRRYVAWRYNKKIRHIVNGLSPPDPDYLKQHIALWADLSPFSIHWGWLAWYTRISGVQSPNFVPESLFYAVIEPILNDHSLSTAWADKNAYDLVYQKNLFPTCLLRNVSGQHLDGDYQPLRIETDLDLYTTLEGQSNIVVKPAIGSDGGRCISFFSKAGKFWKSRDGIKLTLDRLTKVYRSNFVIQERIKPHDFFAQFNPESLNTIRVMTLRCPWDGEIRILHSILRVGAQGSELDNNSQPGSFSIGIRADGHLNSFATTLDGRHHEIINGIMPSKLPAVAEIDEIWKVARQIATKQIHHRILGVDITLDCDTRPRGVEINNRMMGITLPQNNLGPLFGPWTSQVLDFCRKAV